MLNIKKYFIFCPDEITQRLVLQEMKCKNAEMPGCYSATWRFVF